VGRESAKARASGLGCGQELGAFKALDASMDVLDGFVDA
jgi:hypothetical protein